MRVPSIGYRRDNDTGDTVFCLRHWRGSSSLLTAALAICWSLIAPAAAAGPSDAPAPGMVAPGTVVQDCAVCPEMVLIPPGTFSMGVSEEESLRETTEREYDQAARPIQPVTIARPFWFGRFPVTRGEYKQFLSETNTSAGATAWSSPRFGPDDRHPAVFVAHRDAVAYAAWLSAKTGLTYRLPSEAEWEYAARATTTTARYWGYDFSDARRFAWVAAPATAPVGGDRQPNPFGLFDMLGNVWQWTADCWHPNYQGRPLDASVWQGGNCTRRMLRGGSWKEGPGDIRAGVRYRLDATGRFDDVGFRVLREQN